jgi:hypothetical protein
VRQGVSNSLTLRLGADERASVMPTPLVGDIRLTDAIGLRPETDESGVDQIYARGTICPPSICILRQGGVDLVPPPETALPWGGDSPPHPCRLRYAAATVLRVLRRAARASGGLAAGLPYPPRPTPVLP